MTAANDPPSDRTVRTLLPRSLRELPADLAAIGAAVVLANVAVFAPVVRETPLRIPVGIAFVLFVPGYALLAALFPGRGDPSDDSLDDPSGTSDESSVPRVPLHRGIDGVERAVLSFGLSVAVVPLIGLALDFTPWGLGLVSIATALSAFTVASIVVAADRRRRLPEDERFRVPYPAWVAAGRAAVFETDSRADAVVNVVLVASVLLAVVSVGYAVTAPQEGESFSAVYVLTEDDDDLVAGDYPNDLEPGESEEVVVGVDNHEHRAVEYTVVVVEQDVGSIDDEVTVDEQRELDRFVTRLGHDETWLHEHDLEPTMTSDGVRIAWLLYLDGDVPDEPTTENAEHHVHLWLSGGNGESEAQASN